MNNDRNGRKKQASRVDARALDDSAVEDIATLLGPGIPPRDQLIEVLHRIQDHFGALHARHLKALAEIMRLSQAEIFEVASFYHHFDLVRDGEPAPPALTVRVCASVACMIAGAETLRLAVLNGVDPKAVRVIAAPCLGACDQAPAVNIGWRPVDRATPARVFAALAAGKTAPDEPAYRDLSAYRAAGGYQLLAACRAGTHTPEMLIETLSHAGLRGLGGAGFPVGRKWASVRSFPAPRLMSINADEGEPGTFKDRFHLERDPHRVLEGALIAAWAVGAERIYFYLRDEYPAIRAVLQREIAALAATGLSAHAPIELRRGAGAYICGEESAMLESIEGKRGLPRHRPPYIAERGLFGRPTLNHNVETLYWLRDIVEKGPDWFASQGVRGAKGLRSFSVSGRVKDPGVKLAPAGSTARELIDEYCGGMRDGHVFAGYLPGGASGGMLPASLADEPLDFGTLDQFGAFVGSHALVVFSEADDPRAIAQNLLAFFKDESCGQCTPCRLGTEKLGVLISAPRLDRALISELDQVMRDASICGLGQAAPNPVRSLIRFFPEALS